MAQTNFTPISLYYSATSTNVPTSGNLVAGELAINTADGKLFYKDSGGVVQTLATKTAATFPNVNGATSGAVTLAVPAVAGSNTATFPAATGTVMVSGNMPAFSAYNSSAQTLGSATTTKLQFQTEEFDTANAFDNVTNYRFTPQVAGYYQVNGCVQLAITNTTLFCIIFKNGSGYKTGTVPAASSAANVSSVVYLNGSTDYVELYAYFTIGQATATGISSTYFNACMVRGA